MKSVKLEIYYNRDYEGRGEPYTVIIRPDGQKYGTAYILGSDGSITRKESEKGLRRSGFGTLYPFSVIDQAVKSSIRSLLSDYA